MWHRLWAVAIGVAALAACGTGALPGGAPAPVDGGPSAPVDGGAVLPMDGGLAAPGGGSAEKPEDGGAPEVDGSPEDPPDAGLPATDVDAGPPTSVASCFPNIRSDYLPDYDSHHPTLGTHCAGTNHQRIEGIEKVVFLGDSITEGTPPTLLTQYYRSLLAEKLVQKFGAVVINECADFGAHTDDFFDGKDQIPRCFPGPEPRRTLVVFTIGGNDVAGWAKDDLSTADALRDADYVADHLEEALRFFQDPTNFPNGAFVVFANPYEYTDGTGVLLSCPTAIASGLSGNYTDGTPAILYLRERYLALAVEYGVDMVFMAEAFCGHGYGRTNPAAACYAPQNELWFDLTCIHPDPVGHAALADLFFRVIDE